MRNKFSIYLYFLVALFFVLSGVLQTSAYDEDTTHPALTDEIVDFFNLNFPEKLLTAEEKEWVVRGVTEEDMWPRWINHFYDPVNNQGWAAEGMGRLSPSVAMALNQTLLSNQTPLTSKNWAESSVVQAKYKDFDGNRTWQRAIFELAKNNNKKEAYITLGHILHLLEDATVPDHTRNDTHAHPLQGVTGDYGSPYEEYTKRYVRGNGGTNIPNNAEVLYVTGKKPVVRNILGDYFDYLASYSNNNFFSKDTIPSDPLVSAINKQIRKYQLPEIVDYDNSFGYGLDKNGDKFPIANVSIKRSQGLALVPTFSLDEPDRSKEIIDAYFTRLSREAITNGAGIIKLFFDEVEKVKNGEKTVEEPPKEISGVTSVLATIKQVQNTYSASVNYITSLASKLLNSVGIQVASNNQAASQSNSELSDQTPSPAEPVSLPVTIVPTQSAKPLTPGGIIAAQTQTAARPTTPSLPTPPEIILPNPTPAPTIVAPIPVVQQMVYGGGPAGSPAPSLPEPVVVPAQEVFLLPEVVVDIIPPPVPVVTVANQTGVTSTNILVSLQSVDELSPPTYFDLEFSTNTTDWVSLVTSTINTDFNFTGTRGEKYYFKSRATDSLSNVSDWSSASSPVFVNWSGEVVMNEVAWAGTSATFSSDEWFELYNNSNQDINLSGWKILVGGKTLDWSKVNTTTIPSHTFYLFERTNDNTIKEIGADAIYTLSGGFNNSGEKLELIKPNGEKADEVDASGGWFAGDSVLYKSMERLDPDKNGSNPANWQSNQGFRLSGRSFNGGQIYGSPKRSNFGSINLNLDQDEAVRVLVKSGSPYILQYYKVPAGKTLNIEPGVVIKSYFNNSKIDVYGALNAVGLGNKKIIFTSGRDADFAEDINKTIIGSWSGANPLAQDWQGIWFHSGATGALDNIVLRYAGHDFKAPPSPISTNQAVRIEGASIEISNSIFSDNGLLTLYIKDSSSTISNAIFSRGEQAVKSENSSLAISNSSFENFQNNHGPYTYISGPVHVIGRWPHLENLTFTNNDLNMPFLDRVAINESQASIAEFSNILVNSLTVSASSTLDIARGVGVFMPAQTEIVINGSLRAIGTADKPISFSSYPSSTYWKNLKFNNSVSVLDFVNLKRGGNSGCMACGAILANSSDLTINHSNIWDSDTFNAVRATNSTISISNTEIDGFVKRSNNQYGINARGGILRLDNVMLKNLNVGIEAGSPADSLPVLEKKNMSTSSFTNVDYLVEPPTWWDGVVSTTP